MLDELGDDDLGAVRFIYRATLRRAEAPRGLEYVIFARGRDGLLTEVFESLDTLGRPTCSPVSPWTRTRTAA